MILACSLVITTCSADGDGLWLYRVADVFGSFWQANSSEAVYAVGYVDEIWLVR